MRTTPAFVSDFLAEVIALGEFLASDVDNVFGVVIVLGENKRFWHVGAASKDFCEEFFFESAKDGTDLIGGDHFAVEPPRVVGEIIVKLLPADFASLAVALVHPVACFHRGAMLGNVGFDAIDVETYVDLVSHGLLVVVLADEILIKEAERLFRRGGGEADQKGIEVFEDLTPEVVDGAVALVHDNDVEELDGNGGIVDDGKRLFDEFFE
jgi:hypothetical protein